MSLVYKILNILFLAGTLAANYATINGLGPFKPIGNISREFNTSITPPDWTFSIWGLIYAGLIIFSIVQFIPQCGLNKAVDRIGPLFILSCVFNIAWICVFGIATKLSITISCILILGLLSTLYGIQERGGIFKSYSGLCKILFFDTPFSLYFGWVLFATLVNFGTMSKVWGILENDNLLYYITIAVAAALYVLNLFLNKNFVSTLVFFYVCIALVIKYNDSNKNNDFLTYTYSAMGIMAIFVVVRLATLAIKKKKQIIRERLLYNDRAPGFKANV